MAGVMFMLCKRYCVLLFYLCSMKNEIIIPLPKEEDFVAANKRRDKYAIPRDLQAQELNVAMAARLCQKPVIISNVINAARNLL